MEQKKTSKEIQTEEDLFLREERCEKAIKTVKKAIFMRLFVSALLVWILFQTSMELWSMGLLVFVMVINLTGLLPLVTELRKRHTELKQLIAEEDR